MVTKRRELGDNGEKLVAAQLVSEGYKILARNFRCRGGELDIVAEKGGVIFFVEVKTRQSSAFGHPLESITAEKARKLKLAAQLYLAKEGREGADYRFLFAAVNPEQGKAETFCDFI